MKHLTELADDDLLRRMRAGDQDAFTTLYRRHQGAVYRFALRMSGNTNLAEEVTQEVFMTLIREGGQYDPDRGPLGAFLCGIGRNHTLRCLHRERPLVPIEDDDLDGEDLRNPLQDLTQSETVETVRQAVLALPSKYREVVVLCDLEEMSYEDAAQALACPVGTVRSRLNRARALLLAKLRAVRSIV